MLFNCGDFRRAATELEIQYNCSFLQPMEAVLLLMSSPAYGLRGTTLAFRLKTRVSHITPTVSTIYPSLPTTYWHSK